jgi:hypothetical protein
MARIGLTKEEIQNTVDAWRKNKYSKSKTAKDLKIGRQSIRNRIDKAGSLGLLTERDREEEKKLIDKNYFPDVVRGKKADKSTIRKIKSSELIDQERLDHTKIVRYAIAKLSIDECVYDDILRRDLSISNDRWRDVRDLDEFLDFQVLLPNKKRVWCHPNTRDELLKLDGVREVM